MNGTWPDEMPDGFEFVRLMSGRAGATVSIARTKDDNVVALKQSQMAAGLLPEEHLARLQRLKAISHHEGLLPILDCGLSADSKWIWESLALADALDGKFADDELGYTPVTLRTMVIESGPLSSTETVRVGMVLCEGLSHLHRIGLMHRDIKPGNIFMVGGAAKIGDYGLASEIDEPCDLRGTEGFQPLEGGVGPGADLFALGKVLYEIWTGCDRLEFASLPKRVLENEEWARCGRWLNKTILKACHHHARSRFASAEAFREELLQILNGTRPDLTRRRWIGSVIAGGAGVVGYLALRPGVDRANSAKIIANWKLLKRWQNLPGMWSSRAILVDPRRNLLHSFRYEVGQRVLHSISLSSFDIKSTAIAGPAVVLSAEMFHPHENTIWCAAHGRGEVWRLETDSCVFSKVGGSGGSDTDHSNSAYWNPMTQRYGVFGGYGKFRVSNWRWEFDLASETWIELEAAQSRREPWCRHNAWLFAHGERPQMLLFGGVGNSTGNQGERDPGFQQFDGHFHLLGDVCNLDFETNKWSNLVQLPGRQMRRFPFATSYPPWEAILELEGCADIDPHPTPPRVHVFRKGVDSGFIEARSEGTPPDSRKQVFVCFDPIEQRLLCFSEEGVFEINLEVTG